MYDDGPAFMSETNFSEACNALVNRYGEVGSVGMNLTRCHEAGIDYLAISRTMSFPFPSHVTLPSLGAEPESNVNLEEEEYDDDKAAVHHPQPPTPLVEYNIILSSSYRVPVLYITLHNLLPGSMRSVDAVHELLVPEHMRYNLKQGGVIGGISMTNHPVTQVPAYFIHPCNTAEAMRDIIGGRSVSPQEYLQIWFGLVGCYVGLYLPSQLVIRKPQEN